MVPRSTDPWSEEGDHGIEEGDGLPVGRRPFVPGKATMGSRKEMVFP
jgi:hypothetical protein